MGNHCLKRQQTKEMSQIFVSIPACSRLPLDSHEKVVRQQPETYSEVGQKRALTGMAQADFLQWSQPFLTQGHDALRKPGARPSQRNTKIHTSKLFSHSGNEKPSWLAVVEGCWEHCMLLCALCSLAELCPKPSWLAGILAAQGCKRDAREGGISWQTWLLLSTNHRKLSLLCQRNRLEEPLWI